MFVYSCINNESGHELIDSKVKRWTAAFELILLTLRSAIENSVTKKDWSF